MSGNMKPTVTAATEETQCAGLNFFKDIKQGEERDLIPTCIAVSYWCCYETVKKVSPIITEATSNLFFYLIESPPLHLSAFDFESLNSRLMGSFNFCSSSSFNCSKFFRFVVLK